MQRRAPDCREGHITNSTTNKAKNPKARVAMILAKLVDDLTIEKTFQGGGNRANRYRAVPVVEIIE